MYQLRGYLEEADGRRLPRSTSVKRSLTPSRECLPFKWPSTQLEGEWRQLPADVPRPDPCTEFAAANHHIYEEFTAAKQDLYEGMMALVRDTHLWALAAVAILVERMEWMSCSISQ